MMYMKESCKILNGPIHICDSPTLNDSLGLLSEFLYTQNFTSKGQKKNYPGVIYLPKGQPCFTGSRKDRGFIPEFSLLREKSVQICSVRPQEVNWAFFGSRKGHAFQGRFGDFLCHPSVRPRCTYFKGGDWTTVFSALLHPGTFSGCISHLPC